MGFLFSPLTADDSDVLNRFPYKTQKLDQNAGYRRRPQEDENHDALIDSNHWSTVHVMMYIFPRQFGLHNVFTSFVDPRETVQPLKEYTLREEEIARIYGRRSSNDAIIKIRLPRRLRGKAMELVGKLRISHSRCSYNKLLNYYCPSAVSSMP